MGIDHIFHAVGNDITGGQRIEHAVMTHSDTIVDGYGVEFRCITAHLLNLFTDNLTNLMQMCMTRYELCERIHNGDNRLTELFMFHTCGHPQSTGASHPSAFSTDSTS